MNLVLVLRAELVCLIILLYLTFVSRTYRMGKDVRIFNQILFFAIIHVVMDMVTVYTVNSLGDTLLNKIAHVIFYLSAIMYSYEMCIYTLNLSRPQQMDRKKRLLALLPAMIYLVLLFTPLLPIQYEQLNGTKASTGPAATVGFVIAFMYFAVAIGSIFTHWRKVGRHFKRVMLPMLGIYAGVGILIGVFGGVNAIRNYLKV